MNFSIEVKQTLFSLIDEMEQYRWLFTKIPQKIFSRMKKWSFSEVIKFILMAESGSLRDELLKYFDYQLNTPSNSSFNQRRAQILPEALEFLFQEFNQRYHMTQFVDLYTFFIGNTYLIRHILNKDKFADAVINGTMAHLHVQTSIPILEKGYDMLLEKPFAVNEKEAKELLEVVKRTGRKVYVCHVLRYTPFYASIKKHLVNGDQKKNVMHQYF